MRPPIPHVFTILGFLPIACFGDISWLNGRWILDREETIKQLPEDKIPKELIYTEPYASPAAVIKDGTVSFTFGDVNFFQNFTYSTGPGEKFTLFFQDGNASTIARTKNGYCIEPSIIEGATPEHTMLSLCFKPE